MLSTLLSLFTSRTLWGFIGITSLALLIWTMGPLLAINDNRPLESTTNRIIAIIALYLFWGLAHLIAWLWRAWRNKKMLNQLSAQVSDDEPQQSDDPKLVERFEEASKLLKKFSFNRTGKAGLLPKWFSYFGKHYLYELPWYIIIGAPGAGKTTALTNSGLRFPLAERFGKAALRGIGGTRDCDWWFTDEAVLLDTAGRYTTQESQRERDALEWKNFLNLLKQYRPRKPINGAIITISISDLLTYSQEERYIQAKSLHRRLVELREQLKIYFPIYVMVTKTDLLNGFIPYFAKFDKEQRNQIWGFTYPHDESLQPDFNFISEFHHQFRLLTERLHQGLADTLINEYDSVSRSDLYVFPQEFSYIQNILSEYLETVFITSNFETPFTPRGLYFTSGTLEGMPFDHVMTELNRYLQFSPRKNSSQQSVADLLPEDEEFTNLPQGKSFFLKGLLEDVVFKESGLAGSNRWWEYRNKAIHWTGYLLLGSLFVALSVFWYSSYYNNSHYLNEVSDHVSAVEQQGNEINPIKTEEIFKLQTYLDQLVHLPESQDFELAEPPITYRLGLYRGEQVSTASESLYQTALHDLLMPQVAYFITEILRKDNGMDADFSFAAFKAYRMLYDPKYYDGKFLRSWLMLNLKNHFAQERTKSQWQNLDWHLGQLLDNHIQSSPYIKDQLLIDKVHQQLNQSPLSQRIYDRVRRTLISQDDFKPVTLLDLGGMKAELAFKRRSNKPISEGIPGLYTPHAYHQLFNKELDTTIEVFLKEENWVLSNVSDDELQETRDTLKETVRMIYMREYIEQWETLLHDIELVNIANLDQRISTARLLSGTDSPLRKLLLNIAKNVDLTKPEEEQSTQKSVDNPEENSPQSKSFLDKLFSEPEKTLSNEPTPQSEYLVANYFRPIIQMATPVLDNNNSAIPFDETIRLTNHLYSYLTAVKSAANSGMPAPSNDIIPLLQAEAGRLTQPFSSMLLSLAVGASGDSQKKVVEHIEQRISSEVSLFCKQAIIGRYPLSRSSSQDITASDFTKMFAPDTGMMDTFYKQNLEGKVNTSKTPWRFNPGVDGKSFPNGGKMLSAFQQASVIRDTYFSNNKTAPSYQLTIIPLKMDKTILSMVLNIDGQVINYSHGPKVFETLRWPGPKNSNQTSLQFNLIDGRTLSLSTRGTWALNRLFDKAVIERSTSSSGRKVYFNLNGHSVVLEVTPNSVRNPLDTLPFRCP